MIRCPVHPAPIRSGFVRLDAKQRRHLVTVLRLAVGDEFVVVDGRSTPQVAVTLAGAYPISLGSLILRCETAAISALTLVLYALRLTPQGVLWHSCNGKQVKAPTEWANPA